MGAIMSYPSAYKGNKYWSTNIQTRLLCSEVMPHLVYKYESNQTNGIGPSVCDGISKH